MPNKPITLTELRQTGAVADRIKDGEHIKITGHGYVFAVLIPIDDYRSLIAHREHHVE